MASNGDATVDSGGPANVTTAPTGSGEGDSVPELHRAVFQGDLEATRLALEKGADPSAQDKHGERIENGFFKKRKREVNADGAYCTS